MIRITVTGDTFTHRKILKENHYHWNGVIKAWQKIVPEAAIEGQCNAIRPMRTLSDRPEPKIILELRRVDINGNPLSPGVMKVHLRSMERLDGTILEAFNKECPSIVSPPSSPIEPKKNTIDKGFF